MEQNKKEVEEVVAEEVKSNPVDAEFTQEEPEFNSSTALATLPKLAQLDNIGFAEQLTTAIIEGEVDGVMVHLFLKRIESIQKTLKENKLVQEAILASASLHTIEGAPFDYMGAKLALTAVHTTYDFSKCNDPLWTNLNEILETVKEMKTDREKMLKAAFPDTVKLGFTAPRVIVENLYALQLTDLNEEVVLNKPIKIQTTGLKVTFPKHK